MKKVVGNGDTDMAEGTGGGRRYSLSATDAWWMVPVLVHGR